MFSSKKAKFLGIFFISGSLLLSGCFGGNGEEVPEKEKEAIFNKDNVLSRDEKTKLDNYVEKIEKMNNDDILAADFVIDTIMMKDLDNKYFYDSILNVETREFLLEQIKYYELHREYMIYLEKNNASKSDLLLQNRLFNTYLGTFEGRFVNGDEENEIKLVIERLFYKYNINELEVIMENESLIDYINDVRKEEEKTKTWVWFGKKLKFDGEKSIKYITNLTFDLLEPSDRDVVVRLDEIVKDVTKIKADIDFSTSPAKIEEIKNKILNYGEELNDIRINKEYMWLKNTIVKYLINVNNNILKIESGDKFGFAYSEFLVNIEMKEQIVISNYFDSELALQDEKRKALKEAKSSKKDESE